MKCYLKKITFESQIIVESEEWINSQPDNDLVIDKDNNLHILYVKRDLENSSISRLYYNNNISGNFNNETLLFEFDTTSCSAFNIQIDELSNIHISFLNKYYSTDESYNFDGFSSIYYCQNNYGSLNNLPQEIASYNKNLSDLKIRIKNSIAHFIFYESDWEYSLEVFYSKFDTIFYDPVSLFDFNYDYLDGLSFEVDIDNEIHCFISNMDYSSSLYNASIKYYKGNYNSGFDLNQLVYFSDNQITKMSSTIDDEDVIHLIFLDPNYELYYSENSQGEFINNQFTNLSYGNIYGGSGPYSITNGEENIHFAFGDHGTYLNYSNNITFEQTHFDTDPYLSAPTIRIDNYGYAHMIVKFRNENGNNTNYTISYYKSNSPIDSPNIGCLDSQAFNFDPFAINEDTCIAFHYGCTDSLAYNYNSISNSDDGTCEYYGCTDQNAFNYNPTATVDDNSCIEIVLGCIDSNAVNYNALANTSDYCDYLGCMDSLAVNFFSLATINEGCIYQGCTDAIADNFNAIASIDDGSCIYLGCTDFNSINYNSNANLDDGSCIYQGCTDSSYIEFNPIANENDGSCLTEIIYGCMNPSQELYNPLANIDDGSCQISCDTISWIQQGFTLTGNSDFGEVSISGDGNIVAVGNKSAINNSGQVRVFNSENNILYQLGQDINGDINDRSGTSLSLNYNGSIIAIYSPKHEITDTIFEEWGEYWSENNQSYYYTTTIEVASVRVYQFDGFTWNQLGSDINSEFNNDGYQYGPNTVSISNDGLTIAVGSQNNYFGRASVFSFDGNNWVQKGQNIDGYEYEFFGSSVSLSNDGNTLAVGAEYGSNYQGLVRVYDYNGTTWTKIGSDITYDDPNAYEVSFGRSISMSGNGNTVAIGAQHAGVCIDYNNNGGCSFEFFGLTQVYQLINNIWIQKGNDIIGESSDDYSGASVSIANDGNTIVIGAFGNDGESLSNNTNSGHCRVFSFVVETNSWTQIGLDIDGDEGNSIGGSVGISEDGNKIVVGGTPYNGIGTARVFEFDGQCLSGCTETDALNYNALASFNDGSCIDIVEGCSDEEAFNFNPNANIDDGTCCYLESSTIQIGQSLNAGDMYDEYFTADFGFSTSLSGDGSNLIVGSPRSPTYSDNHLPEVVIYSLNEYGLWMKSSSIFENILNNAKFGYSTSINYDGSMIAIGSPDFNTGGHNGSIRIYQRNDGLSFDYSLVEEFNTPFYSSNQFDDQYYSFYFDNINVSSVSLNSKGDILAAGFPGFELNDYRTGLVKIYTNQNDEWIQLGEDITKENLESYMFGQNVNLSKNGDRFSVGGFLIDEIGNLTNVIYVYQYLNEHWQQLGQTFEGYTNSSLNKDGSILALSGSQGIKVYKFENNSWECISDNLLGSDVALNYQGNILFTGDYVYKYDDLGNWNIETTIDYENEYSISTDSSGAIVALGNHNAEPAGDVSVFTYENNCFGCMDEAAYNYDEFASFNDSVSCCYTEGCLDFLAFNFNPLACQDNGSCQYLGCTDSLATNFSTSATNDDGSCTYCYADAIIENGMDTIIVCEGYELDYLVSENSTFDLSFTIDETQQLNIGDYYQGGYIFHLNPDGQSGLICAPFDQSDGIILTESFTSNINLNTNNYDGISNTIEFVNLDNGLGAASLCYNLDLNGYSDWYLPSMDEMSLLIDNSFIINNNTIFSEELHNEVINSGYELFDFFYWTSSSYDCGGIDQYGNNVDVAVAHFLSSCAGVNCDSIFLDPYITCYPVYSTNIRVRAIRQFSNDQAVFSGSYFLNVTDSLGCSQTDSIYVLIEECGCTDEAADNYNFSANIDDGSCIYSGCKDATACNFDEVASIDDGSCIYPIYEEYQINHCDMFYWHGEFYTESGQYIRTVSNSDGCDSILTLNLTIFNSSSSSENITVCDSYQWNGETFSQSGIYSHETVNSNGCDSTANLVLTVLNSSVSIDSVNACNSHFWNGQNYNQSGWYTYSTTNSVGCDSTAYLHLIINNSNSSFETVVACDNYFWNGQNYNQSGFYYFNTQTINGCDSLAIINLVINNSSSVYDTVTACDSYYWNGLEYVESGEYSFITFNSTGCIQTEYLSLTINNSDNSIDTQVHCNEFTWIDGLTYYESNSTASVVLSNQLGCDSIVTLDLTIYYDSNSQQNVIACDEYFWNETLYESSGIYEYLTQNVNGCDSIAVLNLTMYYSDESMDSITVCDSYLWNGIEYVESGEYLYSTQTIDGCDSTAYLNLTINYTNYGYDSQKHCDSFTWINGQTYYENNYTDTYILTNSNGCDSIVTLSLSIDYSTESYDTVVACDNYYWNGQEYLQSGNYTFLTTNSSGCDSIAYLSLEILNSTQSNISVTACDAYYWNGITYQTSGIYEYTTLNSEGCDSTAVLNLTINNSFVDDNNIFSYNICQGEFISVGGNQYSEPGTYFDTLQTSLGCDSLVVTVINVSNLSIEATAENVSCEFTDDGSASVITQNGISPYEYIWSNDQTTSEINNLYFGTYQVTVNDAACSAQTTIDVNIEPTPSSEYTSEICYVTVDDQSGKNKIVINPISDSNVAGYQVYKESLTDIYINIATLDAYTTEFVDTNSNPLISSNRYKIDVIDNCLNTSTISDYHQTVHLSMNVGLNGAVNLDWDEYEGFDVSSYMVFRGNSLNNMEFIQYVSGNTTSFTDLYPPIGTSVYQVRVVAPICNSLFTNPLANEALISDTLKSNVVEHQTQVEELVVNIVSQAPSCVGCNDGFAIANASGGTPPYTYTWTNGVNSSSNLNLDYGIYNLIVFDSNNDFVQQAVEFEINPCDVIPSGLFVDNIIHNRVRFNWSQPQSLPSHYMIRYRPLGTSAWTVMTAGTVNNMPFNGTSRTRYFMQPETTYEWSIRARVLDENGSTTCQSSWSPSSEYTTLAECPNLENLNVNTEANWVTFFADAPNSSWGVWQSKGKVRELDENSFRYINGNSNGSINTLKGNFTAETDYEWHTKAWCTGNVDIDGNSDPQYHSGWGDFSSFSTEAICDKLPNNFTTSTNAANTAVIMSWDTPASGQPDHYFLELSNLTSGALYQWNNIPGTSNSKTKFNQSPGDEISWRIRGACGSNGTSWATIFSQPTTYVLGGVRLENSSLPSIQVYPNPSRGEFSISFDLESKQDVYITITNYLGEVVYAEELKDQKGQYNTTIDLRDRANGVYMLNIITSLKQINKKLIIQ